VKAGDLKDRNAQLFVSLVIGLSQAAYVQLGKVRNEMTGAVETNLEAARITIDTLAALEDRSKGNLTPEEAEVLRRALAELRMNYVVELKRTAGGQVADAGPSLDGQAPEGGA